MYIETHIGFAAAYGLTLGFMVIACIMLIGGKRHYGTAVLLADLVVPLTDLLQSRFRTKGMHFLERSGS